MADKNKSFDLILEELEAIVESMDDGSLKLEETIDSYERGITLNNVWDVAALCKL